LNLLAQRLARPQDVNLADEFLNRFRPHAVGKRRRSRGPLRCVATVVCVRWFEKAHKNWSIESLIHLKMVPVIPSEGLKSRGPEKPQNSNAKPTLIFGQVLDSEMVARSAANP